MTFKDGRHVQPLFDLNEGDIFKYKDEYYILSVVDYYSHTFKAFCLNNSRLETFGSNFVVECYRSEDVTMILK